MAEKCLYSPLDDEDTYGGSNDADDESYSDDKSDGDALMMTTTIITSAITQVMKEFRLCCKSSSDMFNGAAGLYFVY